MKFLQLSRDFQLRSKILTVQNSYNLLCRNFDAGLAECCHHERISLLAYSPMAMGILSGKYHSSDDSGPPDARMNLFMGRYSEGESRYNLKNPKLESAVKHLYSDTPLWVQLFSVLLNYGSSRRFFRPQGSISVKKYWRRSMMYMQDFPILVHNNVPKYDIFLCPLRYPDMINRR